MIPQKKIAIIQSSYIPWKGYFDIINSVDEFILYDEVFYSKNTWRNRNKIKIRDCSMWLTIPINKASSSTRIDEVKVANNLWRKKHWKSICQWYSKSRYFKDYKDAFEDLYLGRGEKRLSLINYEFISLINKILGIQTNITWSTDYRTVSGQTEKLVDLCLQAGGSEYITGPAARSYIETEKFTENNIQLSYFNYDNYEEYGQMFFPFDHYVSIIDLIFNTGGKALKL